MHAWYHTVHAHSRLSSSLLLKGQSVLEESQNCIMGIKFCLIKLSVPIKSIFQHICMSSGSPHNLYSIHVPISNTLIRSPFNHHVAIDVCVFLKDGTGHEFFLENALVETAGDIMRRMLEHLGLPETADEVFYPWITSPLLRKLTYSCTCSSSLCQEPANVREFSF